MPPAPGRATAPGWNAPTHNTHPITPLSALRRRNTVDPPQLIATGGCFRFDHHAETYGNCSGTVCRPPLNLFTVKELQDQILGLDKKVEVRLYSTVQPSRQIPTVPTFCALDKK